MLTRILTKAVRLDLRPQPPLVRTRYPVLLMHGFGALADVLQRGVLHDEAMHLRAHGILAFAPHVNPYNRVALRTEAWAGHLDYVLDATEADRVNLIGFSSGGLDARVLADRPAYRGRIASIVTVSTPHRGTPLVRFVLDRAPLRTLGVAFMETLGRAAFPPPPTPLDALEELSPAGVAAHFPSPDRIPEGIYAGSYAGQAGRGTPVGMYAPLWPLHRILYQLAGPHDGLVPVSSAWWGDRLGLLNADHARQIGMRLAPGGFDAPAFYLHVARMLAGRGL